MKKQWFFSLAWFFILLLGTTNVKAQYYLTGQDPASVKWQQITTKEFRIVFPEGYRKVANEYMNLLQLSAPYINTPYHAKLRRLNVVLHNFSTTSNAMVSPVPFHADFFEMPAQETYAQRWQKQLTLHEFRHAVQMDKMRQGFGNFMYYFLGEQGTAAIFGAYLPLWFIEGDAVWSETVHSNSGRGRQPFFIYPLKAQVLDKGIYKYDKAQFGSYKNFVPDHYTLGYQLFLEGVKNYGTGLWNDVLNQVARKGYTLVPFTHRLKKNTGNKKVKFYHAAMNDLKNQWKKADTASALKGKIWPVSDKFYTSYLFPQVLKNGDIIAEKVSIDDVHRFVKISPDGKVTRLFTPGLDFAESLSADDSLLCWNEKTFDPRWSNRDYSVIKIYNYKTKKRRQITRKSRYFAPALSPDGKTVVAVRIDEQQRYFLDFLDAVTGKKIKTFHTPDNLFFMTPHWSADGKKVVVTVLGNKGKSILLLNSRTFQSRLLLPFSFADLKWPVIRGNQVVYTSSYEGKDNLYVLNIQSGKTSRVYNSRFGATGPAFSPNGQKLFFSLYTADGFKPADVKWHPDTFVPLSVSQKHYTYPVDRLISSKTFNLDDSIVPDSLYPEKKYSRIGHFFNPHSWSLLSLDLNSYTLRPGIMLLSQNVLSTAVTTIGWTYNRNESAGQFNFGLRYLGWYPAIGLNFTYGNRRGYLMDSTGYYYVSWREANLSLNMSVPLNFTRGKWFFGVRPYVEFTEKFLKMSDQYLVEFQDDRIVTMRYQLHLYNRYKRSAKDLYPKWGQDFRIEYENTPFLDQSTQQFAVQGSFYFPGFIRHQSLTVYGGYDEQHRTDYYFSTLVDIPRGYSDIFDDKMAVFKTDYVFPIAYPDMDWQGVMYLKRIYGQVFYDYMRGETAGKVHYYASVGTELHTDWHFLGWFPTVTLGLRYSYAINRKAHVFDFLIRMRFD